MATHFDNLETESISIGTFGSETAMASTPAEVDLMCDISTRVQEITATANGTVTAGVKSVELNHASTAISGTIADLANHEGFLFVKFTGTGTESHVLTCTAGFFDGTHNKLTLDAHDEAIIFYVCSDGTGTLIANVGTVGVSSK